LRSGVGNGRLLTEMPEKKRGVFDVDGVLADSRVPVTNEVNRKWGTNFKPSDINNRLFFEKEITELTGDPNEGKLANEVWFDPDVLFKSLPIKGALEVLTRLQQKNWENWSATARLPDAREVTKEWLKIYFPDIFGERFYMREFGNEDLINSAEIKLLAVGMLKANLLVDDDQATVKYVVRNYPFSGLCVAMLDCGSNQDVDEQTEKLRAKDWFEIGGKMGLELQT